MNVQALTSDQRKFVFPFESLLEVGGFDWGDLPELTGYDRGTNEFADVITQSVDGADLNRMWSEFQRAVALLNRQRTPLINWLTFSVTNPTERVLLPTADDFEAICEVFELVAISMALVAPHRPTSLSGSTRVRAAARDAVSIESRIRW